MGARNNVLSRSFMAVVLCATITLSGCSTAWIAQAEQIVAALIPAASNIMALIAALQGTNVSAQDLQAVQKAGTQATADLQLIQSLIAEYQKADAQAQPGILNQIQTAIGTAQSNLSAILPTLHIKDAATQAKIAAVIGVVLSEVQSLAAVVPLVNPAKPSLAALTPSTSSGQALAAQTAARVGHPQSLLTASEFVNSYNATMTAKTGKTDLDLATSGLRIHVYGKLARWGTAGILK